MLQIIITRRGCICEKCEVFLQDMATTAQLRSVGGLEEDFALSKDAGDGIFAEAEVRQVQNPASYDDYCGCGVLGP